MVKPMADSANAIDFMAFPSLITRQMGELLVSFCRPRARLQAGLLPAN
jgi:hypothetical protein